MKISKIQPKILSVTLKQQAMDIQVNLTIPNALNWIEKKLI